jgi:hypothetical protein
LIGEKGKMQIPSFTKSMAKIVNQTSAYSAPVPSKRETVTSPSIYCKNKAKNLLCCKDMPDYRYFQKE